MSRETAFLEVGAIVAQPVHFGESAKWVMSLELSAAESGSLSTVGLVKYDGRGGVEPVGGHCNPPDELAESIVKRIRSTFEAWSSDLVRCTEVKKTFAELYREAFIDGCVSAEYDVGMHRPGHRISVERATIAS